MRALWDGPRKRIHQLVEERREGEGEGEEEEEEEEEEGEEEEEVSTI